MITPKSYLEAYKEPFIDHEDYEKCGSCWREVIKSQYAKEVLESGVETEFSAFFEEVDRRWRETSLYKEVKTLLETGLTIEEVQAVMEAKGIEI